MGWSADLDKKKHIVLSPSCQCGDFEVIRERPFDFYEGGGGRRLFWCWKCFTPHTGAWLFYFLLVTVMDFFQPGPCV